MNNILSILNWLNEADALKGWGAYENPCGMRDGWYLSYDHPYPIPRSYWKL